MKRAKDLLLVGLSLQVVTFGIFSFVAIAYDWRSSKAEALKPYESEMRKMRKLWWAFYANAVFITGRSIYRTAGKSLALIATRVLEAHGLYRRQSSPRLASNRATRHPTATP